MRKFLTFALALALTLSMSVSAFADSARPLEPVGPTPPQDFGDPIQETSYYDNDLDAYVTERVYFVPDTGSVSWVADDTVSPLSNKSGRGWYKNEKSFSGWSSPDGTTTYWAQGYFVWGDGESSVSNCSGGYDWIPSNWELVSEDVTSGTGKYGYIFNNFAYATYEFAVRNSYTNSGRTFSVTIRVSENGNTI